jgi:hypothetical protein
MQNEFSNNNASKSSIAVSSIFSVVGILFMFFSLWIGLIIIILAIVLFLFFRNFSSDTKVICSENGFTVSVYNKRGGTTVQEYSWSDVTETLYYEKESGSEDSSTTRYFMVSTINGVAFNLYQMKHFNRLVQIFNEHTHHLPYYWEKPHGMLQYSFKKLARIPS